MPRKAKNSACGTDNLSQVETEEPSSQEEITTSDQESDPAGHNKQF